MVRHSRYDVVIVGAGAAGLMCAYQAAERGRKVILLEHNAEIGRKILISGGGRCNFTNIHASADNYLSANPNFCKSALARYTPWDFVDLVESHGIPYHEKKLGQLFCNGSSRELIAMLERLCLTNGVEIRCNCRVESVSEGQRFRLETHQGALDCESLVIATGGLSFAKLGATDFGHRIARQFGVRVTALKPGLVPFSCAQPEMEKYRALSGISLPVTIRANGVQFEEAMLFTHRGLSGPAVLQISSFWNKGDPIEIDLLPQHIDGNWMGDRQSSETPSSLLARLVPKRFAEVWAKDHLPAKSIRHCSNPVLQNISHHLHHWKVDVSGTEGFPKAEVTVGGVDTAELSSKTMETRKVPGLFFIGEVVDVTGWLGGYNFQWAWASGHAAARFV